MFFSAETFIVGVKKRETPTEKKQARKTIFFKVTSVFTSLEIFFTGESGKISRKSLTIIEALL
jgi:hypothetical protein